MPPSEYTAPRELFFGPRMKDNNVLRLPCWILGSSLWVTEVLLFSWVLSCVDFEDVRDLRRYCLHEDHMRLDFWATPLKRGDATGTQAQIMPRLISATLDGERCQNRGIGQMVGSQTYVNA